jgi:hypothetical protein
VSDEELLAEINKRLIPLFWCMLFDHDAIIRLEEPEEPGIPVRTYVALSKRTKEALALARSRWPRVRPVLGDRTDELFQQWVHFVEARASSYIHCETHELAAMQDPCTFEKDIRTYLFAFDHIPRRRRGKPALNKWWRQLLAQCASVDRETNIRPLGEFSYCGVSSDMKEPWSGKPFNEWRDDAADPIRGGAPS